MKKISTANHLGEKNKHVEKVLSLANADVVNIQLKAGEEIPEHDSKRDVVIVIRQGEVKFTVEGNEVHLREGDFLQLNPVEKHSLTAISEIDIVVFQIVAGE
ncbi:cupin domain-containing protein [Chungangia koreensis]|uniref:Cupin domain-containing protein n=1 Tax=Chungangia koreensis TaxID=752657 RepID=A0ABV8X4Y2_9LACT